MLILGGISGAGMMTAVEAYRPILMTVTFGFLGFAFYVAYRPRRSAAGSTGVMKLNRAMLWIVSGAAVLLLFFPQFLTGLIVDEGGFKADMDRTVLAIEGMTCPG